MAFMCGFTSAATADAGLVYTTDGPVVPGEWTGQFKKAKKLADDEGVPLVAFWASPGCGYCQALQRAVKMSTVTSWFKKRGYLLVFGDGDFGEGTAIKTFTRIGTKYPYMAFYWKKPGSKTAEKTRYCGRSGGMYVKGGTLAAQFLGTALHHFPDPVLTVESIGDGIGVVKGGGAYFQDTSVTLTATARSGSVFVGWYSDKAGTKPYPDAATARATKLNYVTGTRDATLYARFVAAATDAESLTIDTVDAYVTAEDGAFELKVPVSSLSVPKLSVKGLPTGLRFDTKTEFISGVAKKPGVYTVTVSATNKSRTRALTRTFTLRVPNFVSASLPGLCPDMGAYVVSVGVCQTNLLDLATVDGSVVSSVTGLPSGLTFNRRTGLVSGVPTRACTNTVYVTARKDRVSTVATVTVVVRALPAWSVGTFNGARRKGADTDGLLTLSVSRTGRISGKLLVAGTTWTASAPALTDVDAKAGMVYADVLVRRGTAAWTNRIEIAESVMLSGQGVLHGETEADEYAWNAYLNLWNTTPWKATAKALAKAPLMTSADGVTLKMRSSGLATAKYLTYSCSTVLIPEAEGKYLAFVYFQPKKTSRVDFEGFSCVFTLVDGYDGIDWAH
ncbi:MAG: putative Ig domain-containing protein [Kiritimatiellia bacterium]